MNRLFQKAKTWCLGLLSACMLLSASAQTVTYFHNDISGTPLVATDASGNVVWKENYKPFGERLNSGSADNNNKLWFAGKPYEPSTGLSYMGARYYDPALGRFMGVDPKAPDPEDIHSLNRYAYANNNPYRFVDPDGHSPIDVAFLMFDLGKLGQALSSGSGVGGAAVDVALSVVGVASPIPGVGQALKTARAVEHGVDGVRGAGKVAEAAKGVGTAAKGSSEAIQVTKSGVALPPGAKHQIPEGYVPNPHRSGSYGEVVDGKFRERLRIDPPTPPGQKGPNYSHYHRDGKGTHFSPRPGDKDPGFGP